MFRDLAYAMDPTLATSVRRSPRPAMTWEQALQDTLRRHPDKTVITELCDVTVEEDLDPVLMTSTVFLTRLSRPHPYIFRNAWYIKVRLDKCSSLTSPDPPTLYLLRYAWYIEVRLDRCSSLTWPDPPPLHLPQRLVHKGET